MKLENCGRCGLEPTADLRHTSDDGSRWYRCPAGCSRGNVFLGPTWNIEQFVIRTERINAAALAILGGAYASNATSLTNNDARVVEYAAGMIEAQDLAAQARFAKAQEPPL